MTQAEQLRQEMSTIRIGNVAAQQPVSGINTVDESAVVCGHGRGGFTREETAAKA